MAISIASIGNDGRTLMAMELTRKKTPQAFSLAANCLTSRPYSPDLNPIEKLWANLKCRWRQTGGPLEELIAQSDYLGD